MAKKKAKKQPVERAAKRTGEKKVLNKPKKTKRSKKGKRQQ